MAIADLVSRLRAVAVGVASVLRGHDYAYALIGLLVISSTYLITVYNDLAKTMANQETAEAFLHGDSGHYLEMAEAFRSGKFLDKYVTIRPHRQPLYPALLAAGMTLGADDLTELGTVNVIVGLVTIFCLYGAGWWVFRSWWVGLAGVVAYLSSDFMLSNISGRILTEPVFALTALVAVICALKYMEQMHTLHLCLAAAAAGLAYLARPNGLFFMAAMLATLLLHDLSQPYLTRAESSARKLHGRQLIKRFGLATLVFVIVTAPSWIPRAIHYGEPFYHGYLSNYLWVDSYEEGHISEPKYGPRDYFSTHDFSDVVERVGTGLEHVFWTVPSKIGSMHYILALMGMTVATVRMRPSYLFLLLFMCVQLLPLIWTAMSNPNLRVHYGGLFPFLLIFIMVLADSCRRGLKQIVSVSRYVFRMAAQRSMSDNWAEQSSPQDGTGQRAPRG